jgi:hypothetical protein
MEPMSERHESETGHGRTSGAWLMIAYCESSEILTLVSSPSSWTVLSVRC